MDRFKKILRQTEFQVFLVCFFLILLNWPFIAVPEQRGPVGLLVYLLLLWAILIVLLFFISRSIGEEREGTEKGGKEAGADV